MLVKHQEEIFFKNSNSWSMKNKTFFSFLETWLTML